MGVGLSLQRIAGIGRERRGSGRADLFTLVTISRSYRYYGQHTPLECQVIAGERDLMKILIVEDNPTDRNALMRMLSKLDVSLVCCGSANEAQGLLESGGFDLAVVGLGLVGVGGEDFTSIVSCDLVLISGCNKHLLDVSRRLGSAVVRKDECGYQLLVSRVRSTLQLADSKYRAARLEKLHEGVL
jgi:hypothetical protein